MVTVGVERVTSTTITLAWVTKTEIVRRVSHQVERRRAACFVWTATSSVGHRGRVLTWWTGLLRQCTRTAMTSQAFYFAGLFGRAFSFEHDSAHGANGQLYAVIFDGIYRS